MVLWIRTATTGDMRIWNYSILLGWRSTKRANPERCLIKLFCCHELDIFGGMGQIARLMLLISIIAQYLSSKKHWLRHMVLISYARRENSYIPPCHCWFMYLDDVPQYLIKRGCFLYPDNCIFGKYMKEWPRLETVSCYSFFSIPTPFFLVPYKCAHETGNEPE